MGSSRAGNLARISARLAAVNSSHCAISAAVRLHPMQIGPDGCSVQIFTQGDAIGARREGIGSRLNQPNKLILLFIEAQFPHCRSDLVDSRLREAVANSCFDTVTGVHLVMCCYAFPLHIVHIV